MKGRKEGIRRKGRIKRKEGRKWKKGRKLKEGCRRKKVEGKKDDTWVQRGRSLATVKWFRRYFKGPI